jgi:O-antigen ligase
LPFIGSADQDTVAYRQQLFDVSMTMIRQNPVFGDPFVYLRMEELRQGQGIIDLVNGYLYTALFNGLVGLSLICGVFAFALWRASAALLRVRNLDAEAGALGAALVAVFAASLFYVAAAGYEKATYIFTGILISYAAAVLRPAARWSFEGGDPSTLASQRSSA